MLLLGGWTGGVEKKAGNYGVLLLSRNDVQDVVHACDSEHAERQWFTLISDCGPLLLGNWHRAPDAGEGPITSLRNELTNMIDSHSGGVFLFGDLNIHHKKWLRFSNGNSHAGDLLLYICNEFDFHQCVREPTRPAFGYLLDLVLTHGEQHGTIGVFTYHQLQTTMPYVWLRGTKQRIGMVCKRLSVSPIGLSLMI